MKNVKFLFVCLLSTSSLLMSGCVASQINSKPASNNSSSETVPDKFGELTINYQLSGDGTYYIVTGASNSNGEKGGAYTKPINIPAEYNGLPVKRIANNAFESYGSVPFFTLPNTIEYIGDEAFKACVSLTSFIMPDNLKVLGTYVFGDDTKLVSVNLKQGLERIGRGAFYGCEGLRSVSIPNSVTEMGEEVFGRNLSLTTVSIGSGITVLPSNTFLFCTSLVSIDIPSNVISLGDHCFAGCSSLEEITFHENLQTIGDSAFIDCESLVSVHFPESLTTIGLIIFYRCSRLEHLYFGSRLEDINNFIGECPNLLSIDVSTKNPYFSSKDGVLYSKDGKTLFNYPAGKAQNVIIDEGVNIIKYQAFSDNHVITDITLSSTVYEINGFCSCNSLQTANLDSKISIIDDYVFVNCPELESVILPVTLQAVFGHAFDNCPKLATVRYSGTVEQWNENVYTYDGFYSTQVREVICSNGTVTLTF